MSKSRKFVVSMMLVDRAGIMRDITSAITDMGANIDAISQTVVEGYFTVILTASFDVERSSDEISAAIERNFEGRKPGIIVKPFEDMSVPQHKPVGDPYIIVLSGTDRPGILKLSTTFLAERDINIEDWASLVDGVKAMYIAEITVPRETDVRKLQAELKEIMATIDIGASVRHQNIFRATNEIGPIKSLLEQGQAYVSR